MPLELVVLGGGFAGLWAALAAARRLELEGVGAQRVRIRLINVDRWHSLRVRNYEGELSRVRIPLAGLLAKAGVERIEAAVAGMDTGARRIRLCGPRGVARLPVHYDQLVFALGSHLVRPPWPAAEALLHDVDTHAGAVRLATHLRQIAALPSTPDSAPERRTVLVVGAGATGIEVASELATRLRAAQPEGRWRVILADSRPAVGISLGDEAVPVIGRALAALGVETRTQTRVAGVDDRGASLLDGSHIDAGTVVWCGGMRANPLTACLGIELDARGRIPVDVTLRVAGGPLQGIHAAGDAAACRIDGDRWSVMSCQHSRPMGRYAGHNAVGELLGLPPVPLQIPWYVNVVDLGAWGAVHMVGWEHRLFDSGASAKRTKMLINHRRIVPPRSGGRTALLAAAAPVVQAPPYALADHPVGS